MRKAKRPIATNLLLSAFYSPGDLLDERLTREAVLLEDFTQTLEALDLNLPDTLTGQADLEPHIFKGAALMTAQAEAANHHLARLFGQFRKPLIDALREIVILQQLALWKYNSHVQNRAVFIQDYDQEIARQLVQSVDVWLNVPRRPLVASGTSGEKVAMNGGLNLSVLDGWWMEGYDGTNGFAIGGTSADGEAQLVDLSDADSLYQVLEQEVIPTYYERDQNELPRKWIAMMKRSIVTLVPEFNSDRMVAEYARKIYK